MNHLDPENLKIPAYMRNKALVSQAKQKLILTALDRKEAGLKPNSKRALAPIKSHARTYTLPRTPSKIVHQTTIESLPEEKNIFEKPQKFIAIGDITHYISNINVAIIKLTNTLKVGDIIVITGENELSLQKVEEMQIDRQPVKKAKNGAHIGLKVAHPALVNGKIYKVEF